MLEARKNRLFEKIFTLYNRNLLRRRFNSLRVCGLENLKLNQNIPLLAYANHSSWWDGLVMFEVSTYTEFEWFVMMEEKQLKKLFPFRWLGAFSVVRENPRQAFKSINYAAELMMKNPKTAILIFPQGEILPNDKRPMSFQHGAARIIEKVGKAVSLPIAMRYEFLGNFKPEIFLKIDKPEKIEAGENPKKITKTFEEKMTKLLDSLKLDILSNNLADYKDLLSTNKLAFF
jgi:1-acyl-sn-glycerol-3-phosphate acyltransferase